MQLEKYKHAAPSKTYHDVMVGVQTSGGLQWHIAVFYKHNSDETFMFHLLWHHTFKNESAANGGTEYWVTPIGETSLISLEIMCAAFSILDWSNAPYGLDSDGHILDHRKQFVSAPPGKGFTCSTAVLAIFRSLGFDLIDPTTWPERKSDAPFQDWVIATLQKQNEKMQKPDLDEHIAEMKKDLGSKRIRPTEMAAAAYIFDQPTNFLACLNISEQIEQEVRLQLGV